MRFDVLTLFPDMFPGYLGQSLLHKAIERGLVEVYIHNIRDWTTDRHHCVDDRPYGGGPGMVLMAPPVVACAEDVMRMDDRRSRSILLTPQGETWTQRVAEELSERYQRITLLCGRYEGFDQRVIDILQPAELSVGDFVLNGGEVAAMVVIDTLIRLVPGVLGDEQSNQQDSFSRANRLLEFPQYTRPRDYRGHEVPDVLLSGDHAAIAKWRHEQTLQRTRLRRRDLLDQENEATN